MLYGALGKDSSQLPYLASWGKWVAYASRDEVISIGKPNHPIVKKGLGFFDGKRRAEEEFKKQASASVNPEKLLNNIFQSIASSQGVGKQHIPWLKHFTDEEIIKIIESQLE